MTTPARPVRRTHVWGVIAQSYDADGNLLRELAHCEHCRRYTLDGVYVPKAVAQQFWVRWAL